MPPLQAVFEKMKECVTRMYPLIHLYLTSYQQLYCLSDFHAIWQTVIIHKKLLGKCECSENQVSDSHTEIQGINEFLCTFHIFWPVWLNTDIMYRRSSDQSG